MLKLSYVIYLKLKPKKVDCSVISVQTEIISRRFLLRSMIWQLKWQKVEIEVAKRQSIGWQNSQPWLRTEKGTKWRVKTNWKVTNNVCFTAAILYIFSHSMEYHHVVIRLSKLKWPNVEIEIAKRPSIGWQNNKPWLRTEKRDKIKS